MPQLFLSDQDKRHNAGNRAATLGRPYGFPEDFIYVVGAALCGGPSQYCLM